MTDKLRGTVRLTKRLRQNPIWERPDYGYCWIDLLLLANDQDRETFIKGEAVSLKRGQLAWSVRSLEAEWGKSGEWIERFLAFCKDHGMVKVETRKNRGTVITVLNYDAYNPQKPDTETGSDSDTETGSEPEWKGERGSGNRKGERASAPPEKSFSEIPSDESIQCFCAEYRDLARGVDQGIGEVWWRGWLASFSRSNRPFPTDWKRSLKLAFTADIVARHPKAMLALSGRQGIGAADSEPPLAGGGKKNAGQKNGARPDGRTVAQARFELQRELEALTERLDAAHEIGAEPSAADVKRERELKQELKQLNKS